MNDLDIQTITPFSQTTSLTYWEYCALPPTDPMLAYFVEKKVIDSLFCSWIWYAVQILTVTAIVSGLVFILLLLDNILVWEGYSFWYDPRVKSDTSVKHVRRGFKIGLMGCISSHFLAQTVALGICSWIIRSGRVEIPSRLTGYFGFYGGWASVFLDLLFLVLFNYSDKMTFFHVPMDVHVDKDRGFNANVSV